MRSSTPPSIEGIGQPGPIGAQVPVATLYITWYKQHGTTEGVWLMSSNSQRPFASTGEDCLRVLHHYKDLLDDPSSLPALS